jgi:hypothetical protein
MESWKKNSYLLQQPEGYVTPSKEGKENLVSPHKSIV